VTKLTARNANAFAHTFYFLQRTNPPQKKIKRVCKPTLSDSADIANLTRQTSGRKEERTDNKGYTTMRGSVLPRTVCARFNICASYEHLWLESRTACSPKTLCVIVKRQRATLESNFAS